jgi:multicomponent Na+:H+ antiporter subunit D
MRILLLLPPIVPLLAAVLCLLAWRWRYLQRVLGLLGCAGLLLSAIALLRAVWDGRILTLEVGSWPAPFGITFVADLFSAVMVLLAGIIGFAVVVYSLATMDARRESFGYYPLLNLLLMGVSGAFLTGDIFNMFVWFEVLLISSFVLLSLGGEQAQMEGAIKYVTLNLLSSALFLAAVAILYGLTGALNLADLSRELAKSQAPGLTTAAAMLFLVAFGIKAAIFPLFFWLPASYHTPPVAVSAVFSGLLTKVGVYALIRVFTLLFVHDVPYTHTIILVIAALTMLVGILGALAQDEFRRLLSFQVVSHIGYMMMGLGLFTPLAVAGAIFYIAHDAIVKTNLFLVSGVAHRLGGSFELKRLGGLYRSAPLLAALFLIPALSLAGMPPLSGFFGKLALVQAGVATGQYAMVAVALLVGLLTLVSMMRVWQEAFWKPRPGGEPVAARAAGAWTLAPVAALALLTIAISFGAESVFRLAQRAAGQLMEPAHYVEAVLGGRR